MKNLKSTLFSGLLVGASLLAGCNYDGNLPAYFNDHPRPITVVACNEEGIILKDGHNDLFSYAKGNYLAAILIKQGCKPGDILNP